MAGMQPDTACLNALLTNLQGAKQWQHVVQVFQAARHIQVISSACNLFRGSATHTALFLPTAC